jgi:sporulation protein YlmC with PRC-barrel domain
MNKLTIDNFTRTNSEGIAANVPLKYLTASSVIGDKVHDEKDNYMGEIKDVMLDIASGEISYFVIKYGGFLGFGVKYFAVPFNMLRVNPAKKIFVSHLEKKLFEQAPGFDLKHWPLTNAHHHHLSGD